MPYRRDMGLGWGDRDWDDRDPDDQWRVHGGRPYGARDRGRAHFRGEDLPYDAIYGTDYGRREFGRSPDAMRYDAEDFEGGGYYGMRRPNYSGRGPRGYRRTDERIREEVNDRLAFDPDLDPGEVDVRVDNGIVTLTGVVEDRTAKKLAEHLVERVLGVDDVHNQLKVRHGLWARVTGEHVRDREVERAPQRDTAVGAAATAAPGGDALVRSTSARAGRTRAR